MNVRYLNINNYRKAIFFHCLGVSVVMPYTTKLTAIEMFENMYSCELNIYSQKQMIHNTQSSLIKYIKSENIVSSISSIDLTSKEIMFQTQHDYFYYRNVIDTLYPNNNLNVTSKFINYLEIDSTWIEYLETTYRQNK